MVFDSATWWLAVLLLGALTGWCGWMFKRTSEKSENELDSVKKDIREIQSTYTSLDVHNRDFGECRKKIADIAENYLTKDDFFREQAKTERKLDQILDILMKKAGVS